MSRISDIARLLYVDPNRRAEFIRLMQEQGVVKNFESQIYRKDGTVIWISENARAVRNRGGRIEYYEGMVEDITARKEAEEKLRFSETRFRSVWQNSTDGMRLTDDTGHHSGGQPVLLPIVGMPAEELVGRNRSPRAIPRRRIWRKWLRIYQQRFAERAIDTQLEREVTFRSGRTADMEMSNTFIDLEEGRSLLLGVFRDITKRKQAEERERRDERGTGPQPGRAEQEERHHGGRPQDGAGNPAGHAAAALPSFPLGAPPSESLLQFRHRYHPTSQVGGDFFNILRLSQQQGGPVYLRRHGSRGALGAGHGHGARLGRGTASHRDGSRPIADPDQLAISAPSSSKPAHRFSPPPFTWWPTWNRGSCSTPTPGIPDLSSSIATLARWKSSNTPMEKPVPPSAFLRTRPTRPPLAPWPGRHGHAVHRRALRGGKPRATSNSARNCSWHAVRRARPAAL